VAVNQRHGSDVALLNGMMDIIIANGWHDKEYIEARTEGYADLQSIVDRCTPERVSVITGVGVATSGVNPLRGQNNVQGAFDMGGLPNVFPGYQPVSDPEVNTRFLEAWRRSLPDKPGLTITDMVPAMLEGRLKALYVIGENPKLNDPDWNYLHHALKNLDLLVVQELFLSATAQVAEIVLMAASSRFP
jgi:predicted molibdopterin-dependent oxidoreductase YjgC